MLTRLNSLDVFRGLTITLMILVNSPGNQTTYHWLAHSAWNGCTLADFVFPFFILIGGISSALSIMHLKFKKVTHQEILKKIVLRSFYLFALGLLLNILPLHFNLSTLRVLGVLQRIALCYFFSSLLFLTVSIRTQFLIFISVLLGYAFLIQAFFPIDSSANNLVGYIDKLVLSSQNLYTPDFDPEGILSTLPSIATALLGNLIGYYLINSANRVRQFYALLISGLCLISLGWIWQYSFPLNKSLWSSSYVLWTGGWGIICLAACFYLIEIKNEQRLSRPFILLGKNSLWLYVLHVLFLKIQAVVLIHQASGETVNLRLYITDLLFNSWSSINASLGYAVLYTVFWFVCLKIVTSFKFSSALNRI